MALGSTTDITPLNPQSSKTQPLSLFYEGKTRWSTCWKPGSPEFKWRPLFQQSRDIRDHFHSSVGGTSDYRGLSPSISRYELTGAPYTILIAILCSSQNQNFLKSVCIIKGKKNNKSSKGKANSNIQRKHYMFNGWSFSRNSAGQKRMAGYI